MSLRSRRSLAAAIALLLASAAVPVVHGQPVAPTKRPDPLNPKAEVPPVAYRSALSGYRPAGDVKVGSWRDANDTVTRIGGWRTYAREAAQPEGTAATPAVAPSVDPSAAPSSAPPVPPSAPAAPSSTARPAAPATPPASAAASTPARPAGGHGQHGKP